MFNSRRAFLAAIPSAIMLPGAGFAMSTTTGETSSFDPETIYKLVNRERARRGLRRLKVNSKLVRAASKFSNTLDRKKYGVGKGRVTFKAHGANAGKQLKARARNAGYKVRVIGEAVGYYQSPAMVVPGWMNSQYHRQILLHPKMVEMGLGNSGKVYVLMLGKSK